MAIFNEAYIAAYDMFGDDHEQIDYTIEADTDAVNEAVGVDDAFAGLVTLLAGAAITYVIGYAIKSIADKATISSALTKYPKDHLDCIPIDKFKRKLYTIKPYEDAPGEEMGPAKRFRADKGLFKRSLDKCVCYFDDNDKLAMFYCYKSKTKSNGNVRITTRTIGTNIVDKKLLPHSKYYITAFLKEQKMTNKDSVEWAKSVMKE